MNASALFSAFELAEEGFSLTEASQARARKRLRLRVAQVPSFPSVSAGGAPNSRDLLAQSRAQTWRAHSPVSTSSTRLANSLPALGQPRLPIAGECEKKISALREMPGLLFERAGSDEPNTSVLHEALVLLKQSAGSRTERTPLFPPAHLLRGAVWLGRGIGRAERDEEGAGFRRPSSSAQRCGHSVEPRASEGFAKAAAGRDRLTRLGYTTPRRSNEKTALYRNTQPLARWVAHPKALSRNNEQFKTTANKCGLTPLKRSAAMRLDLAQLPNLGPKSQQMLHAAGIHSVAQLQALGSVAVYAQVKRHDPHASLNLLWALEGALSGMRWQDVAQQHRASLLLALDDLEQQNNRGLTPLKPTPLKPLKKI